jgi:peroxiredoxin
VAEGGGGGIELGDPAPALRLEDTDGSEHVLDPDEPEAPVTVVVWTCNHCPYALAWHDRLLAVAREYEDAGVRFLAINSNDAERYPADSPEAMRERVIAEDGWPFPYLHDADQSVARAFGAEVTPDLFVFDDELRLRYRGAPDADHQNPSGRAIWLRLAIEALLSGEEPDPAETEPVGCSIKWKA